jgi:hypothetical protein
MTAFAFPEATDGQRTLWPGSAYCNRLNQLGLLIGLVLICTCSMAKAGPIDMDAGSILRERYVSLEAKLRTNQFRQPLVLDSTETSNHLQGDIYATIAYPIDRVSAAFSRPDNWCETMLLHINTKYCHAVTGPAGTILTVNIGSKKQEKLSDAGRLEFKFNIVKVTPDYVQFSLEARDGPLGASDSHIRLEAVALPNGKTFMHLTYSYSVNLAGRLAMKTYLGTVGSDKVGFTVIGTRADGQADYIDGVRGVVERNTMRYYLAIESFLGATDVIPEGQFEHRMQSWFSAVERYPRQLHEMTRDTYLEMKRAEHLRQQAAF